MMNAAVRLANFRMRPAAAIGAWAVLLKRLLNFCSDPKYVSAKKERPGEMLSRPFCLMLRASAREL